jgi:hypothetical protein
VVAREYVAEKKQEPPRIIGRPSSMLRLNDQYLGLMDQSPDPHLPEERKLVFRDWCDQWAMLRRLDLDTPDTFTRSFGSNYRWRKPLALNR